MSMALTVFPHSFLFIPVKEKRKCVILFKESALIFFNLRGDKRNSYINFVYIELYLAKYILIQGTKIIALNYKF